MIFGVFPYLFARIIITSLLHPPPLPPHLRFDRRLSSQMMTVIGNIVVQHDICTEVLAVMLFFRVRVDKLIRHL